MTTIAVVDDQATSRQLLTRLITQLEPNAQVLAYDHPAELLECMDDTLLDMLFVDYRMPGINGVELIKRFRRTPLHRDVPVVLVTISEEHDVRLEALEAGATEFLNKPYHFAEFRARTRNLLTLRRYQLGLKARAQYLEQRVNEAVAEAESMEHDAASRLVRLLGQALGVDVNILRRHGQAAHALAVACRVEASMAEKLTVAAPLSLIGSVTGSDHVDEQINYATSVLGQSRSSILQLGLTLAQHRLERVDGSGQPQGLKGDAIPLVCRVSNTIVALEQSLRQPGATLATALTELSQQRDRYVDAQCIDALLGIESALLPLYSIEPDLRSDA